MNFANRFRFLCTVKIGVQTNRMVRANSYTYCGMTVGNKEYGIQKPKCQDIIARLASCIRNNICPMMIMRLPAFIATFFFATLDQFEHVLFVRNIKKSALQTITKTQKNIMYFILSGLHIPLLWLRQSDTHIIIKKKCLELNLIINIS